ncbi:MAG: excinuclease ABC subunit UvrC, partial [Gemmatimonadetes bacterium]|nr:excinuclease ABC subunit UvrC [Gemmatimonadota bacterium]
MPDRHSISAKVLSRLPTGPGVYLFRGESGEVLYVGKAKSLRSRVRSYFRRDGSHSIKTQELVRRVAGLDTIVVGSEAEALILEANLIKEHHPRFNIQLRDDKKYPYIKVTTREPFPRVFVTRNVRNDGSRYFGPFTSVGPLRQALEVVKRLYWVRSCRYNLPREAPDRPCLDYHIGRCLAPCVGLQSREEYRGMVREILRILDGETEDLRSEVEEKMQKASEELRFEDAARLRDVGRGLETIAREQRVHRVMGEDQDILALARDGEHAAGVALRIRRGLLLGRETIRFSDAGSEEDTALLSAFVSRYYLGRGEEGSLDLPKEVLLPLDFPDRSVVEEVLSDRAGKKVRVLVPKRGAKRRLVELGGTNAQNALEDSVSALAFMGDRADEVLFQLQDRLDLKVVPRTMVCFDVSHIQGSETVGSVVLFENGAPKKGGYRHMRIRGEWGNDDYRSMAETVTRYFRRALDEERVLPDLVIIDGGKGQLNAALGALEGLGLSQVTVASLAKKEEEVYLANRPRGLVMSRRDPALHLLQRIRDEAHRI